MAAVRHARLVEALRKAALWIHTDRAHATAYFEHCAEEPCVSITERLREASRPRPYVRKAVTEPAVVAPDDSWERRQLDRARAKEASSAP